MSKVAYELKAKVGTYEKNGETKGKYRNVGVMMQGNDGPYILMDRTFNPAGVPNDGRENIIVSCFLPRGEDGQSEDTPF